MTLRALVAAAYLLALWLSVGCNRESPREPARAEAASASTTPRSSAASERPMAGRQEAQHFLDSAAVLLSGGDTDAAIPLLHRAGAAVQVGADEPRGPASGELLAMADLIDRFAGALARRQPSSGPSLPRISALLNLAEAERHLSLASVACSTRSRESIHDELTIALDHVERAARDGGLPLTGPRRDAVAEARQAAAPLATDCAQDLGPLDDAIANLQLEIAGMRRSLAVQE